MNWKQLYTAATPAEREEILLLLLQRVEDRRSRWVLARGRLFRERRRGPIAHFVGDRRLQSIIRRRKALWTAGLVSAAIITWFVAAFEALHAQPFTGAILVIGFDLFLATILLIKPYLRWRPVSIDA